MSTEGPLEFVRPNWGHCLQLVFWGAILFMGLAWLDPEMLGSAVGLLSMLGFCLYAVVLGAVLAIQRVIIDGPTVRVMNTASMFRWRTFDVDEVVSVTYTEGGNRSMAQALIVRLKPSQGRSWERVDLTTFMGSSFKNGIDKPLFVEFMRAVSRVQPGIEVQKLPAHYRGVLPMARPADPYAALYADIVARPSPAQCGTKRRERSRHGRKKGPGKEKP
jgi:hypothetical protein